MRTDRTDNADNAAFAVADTLCAIACVPVSVSRLPALVCFIICYVCVRACARIGGHIYTRAAGWRVCLLYICALDMLVMGLNIGSDRCAAAADIPNGGGGSGGVGGGIVYPILDVCVCVLLCGSSKIMM